MPSKPRFRRLAPVMAPKATCPKQIKRMYTLKPETALACLSLKGIGIGASPAGWWSFGWLVELFY